MRAVLVVALGMSGSVALADEAPPTSGSTAPARTRVPLRVVRVMADTQQALLFDLAKNKNVLVELGETVEGYAVTDIDDDEVVLAAANGAEVVLAAPMPWRARERTANGQPPLKAEPSPQDPYADPEKVSDTISAAPAPATVSAPAAASAAAPVAVAVPVPASAPAAEKVSDTVSDSATLSRAEVNATLGDFSRLSQSVHASFTPSGLHLDLLTPGSLLSRANLRAGDTITAIDDLPLRTLDDAATLYARASSAKTVQIHLVRADKPLILHIAIL